MRSWMKNKELLKILIDTNHKLTRQFCFQNVRTSNSHDSFVSSKNLPEVPLFTYHNHFSN